MYTLNKRTPAMLAHAAQHGLPKAEDFWVQKERQGGEAERCEPRLAGAASYLYNTTRYMAETA